MTKIDEGNVKMGELWYINDTYYIMGDNLIDAVMTYKEKKRNEMLPNPVRKAKYIGMVTYQDKSSNE